MAAIANAASQLERRLSAYQQRHTELLQDGNYSQQRKTELVGNLYRDNVGRIEDAVKSLWGDITGTEDNRNILSDSGLVWTTFRNNERALDSAKQQAADSAYSGYNFDLIAARVNSFMAMSFNNGMSLKVRPATFIERYEALPPIDRIYLQDTAYTSLAALGDNTDAKMLMSYLGRERDKRLNTPAVIRAQEGVNAALQEADAALRVSKRAADVFGRTSYYLSNFQQGIYRGFREGYRLEIDRRPWGVTIKSNMQFTGGSINR
ncbi:MAG: hypothetical protein CMJ42_18435 [Phyllobacteriaceae bacterium]|nr:hypothetical protein [Phyllobacteriaceae bacterium]